MTTDSVPLIFLHVPKTGGTTLSPVVNRHFTAAETYSIKGADISGGVARLKALPVEQRAAIRLLRGHQSFGLHAYLAPGARYIAMLRHPVGRIASHYSYIKRSNDHHLHEEFQRGGYNLATYATSRLFPDLHNGQTRLLAGIWDNRALGEADLQAAITHIEQHFSWVGLVERFDESLVQLGFELGWRNVTYQKRNVDRQGSSSQVDDAARAAILAENVLDLRLYQYVAERFSRVSATAAFARKLAAASLGLANPVAAGLGHCTQALRQLRAR